jgi:DNA (cytosine-5)-methyltransferase 3A
MNVLSLFDGMSCLQIAMKELGLKVDNYFASEIDKHAIAQTQLNFPNTIQLGSVTRINTKTIFLSEVYSYICNKYFKNDIHNLQSIIPEWEMLHRINEAQTFAAYYGTQVENENKKIPTNSNLSINDRIWFWKCPMGGDNGVYDIARSGSRGKIANKIDVGDLCKYSFWWNGDRQHESRVKEEGFFGADRVEENRSNKTEAKGNRNQAIFESRGKRTPKNESKSAVPESNNETKPYKCNGEKRLDINSGEEERNGREKKSGEVCKNEGDLQTNNEVNRVGGIDRVFLSIYKEVQVTIIECEWGVIISKGIFQFTGGGSPCTNFSFAGKRKGMSTKSETEILTLEHYLQLKSEGFEFEGQSYLFWEYMRILTDIRKVNPSVKFLLENVEMGEKWEKILSRAIGVNGIHINSALVSAQNRKRIYWTNIGMQPQGLFGDLQSIITQPRNKGILLKDILETEVDEKYFLSEKAVENIIKHKENQTLKGFGFGAKFHEENEKMGALKIGGKGVDDLVVHNLMPRSSKSGKGGTGPLSRNDGKTYCLDTGNTNAIEVINKDDLVIQLNPSKESGGQQPYQQNRVYSEDGIMPALNAQLGGRNNIQTTSQIRRLTPTECAKLQTIPEWYTWNCSDTQQYRMLGNGWTISVITHILNYLKN